MCSSDEPCDLRTQTSRQEFEGPKLVQGVEGKQGGLWDGRKLTFGITASLCGSSGGVVGCVEEQCAASSACKLSRIPRS